MYNHYNRFHREALCNSKNVHRNTNKYNPLGFICSLQDKKFNNSPFQLVALKKRSTDLKSLNNEASEG